MEINSRQFYEHHNASYFCKAIVVDGRVTQLYQELGREGGAFWFRDMPHGPKSPQEGLTMLGRHFGEKFYAAVVEAAHGDTLLTLELFRATKRRDEIAQAAREVESAKKKLGEAERAYKRVRK